MRNVFDQYSQPENRVTHALTTALHEDPALMGAFLKEIAKCALPRKAGRVEICAQTYPGKPEPAEEDEAARRGTPDAWITCGEEWCLLIENKILLQPRRDQLERHLAIARRLGYDAPNALLLTVAKSVGPFPDGVCIVEWRDVYRWLVGQARQSPWAERVATYLERLEEQMAERGQLTVGTLTAFNGFRVDDDHPYSYLEAKRALGLAMEALRKRVDLQSELGMDPGPPGRHAIRRSRDLVWDFLPLGAANGAHAFTEFPHLSLGFGRTELDAMVTVPNGIQRPALRRLINLGPTGFRELAHDILRRIKPALARCPGMEPRVIAQQRRFPTQNSPPFHDAIISFDLRTAFPDAGPPKTQPQWLAAVYDCLADKRSNFEFQIGAHFPHRTCTMTGKPEILDSVAETWTACRPLVDVLVLK